MQYVGVDLHKKTISLCVMIQEGRQRVVRTRKRFACANEAGIYAFFESLGEFEAVMEATAAYEWFWQLLEPLGQRLVLAHPKKLRVIAETKHKSDRIDAQVLAEFLLLDMIPSAYRPTPRQREHRMLVRQRDGVQRRITSVKTRIRCLLSHYNADISNLFSQQGRQYLRGLKLRASDRFAVDQLCAELDFFQGQLAEADRELRRFAKHAPIAEKEMREVLETIPCVGVVTVNVVVSELGDLRRFRSLRQVAAYAGLAPGIRESGGARKELGITHDGSKLLRWAMVETAWRMVNKTRRWESVYEKLKRRAGPKKAIVAVARRLLGVMVSMMRSGSRYRMSSEIQI